MSLFAVLNGCSRFVLNSIISPKSFGQLLKASSHLKSLSFDRKKNVERFVLNFGCIAGDLKVSFAFLDRKSIRLGTASQSK